MFRLDPGSCVTGAAVPGGRPHRTAACGFSAADWKARGRASWPPTARSPTARTRRPRRSSAGSRSSTCPHAGGAGAGCQDRRRVPGVRKWYGTSARPDRLIEGDPLSAYRSVCTSRYAGTCTGPAAWSWLMTAGPGAVAPKPSRFRIVHNRRTRGPRKIRGRCRIGAAVFVAGVSGPPATGAPNHAR
jgi:hypothetical protein